MDEGRPNPNILERTVLPNGRVVSTIRLDYEALEERGMFCKMVDTYLTKVPPEAKFETMVFPKEGNWRELDVAHTTTEIKARAVHQRMADKWTSHL